MPRSSADQSLTGTAASSPPHQTAAHITCPRCQTSDGFTGDHTNQFLFLIKPIPAVCCRKHGQKGLPYIVVFWKEAAGEDLHHVVGLWGKPEMKKAVCHSVKTPLQFGVPNLPPHSSLPALMRLHGASASKVRSLRTLSNGLTGLAESLTTVLAEEQLQFHCHGICSSFSSCQRARLAGDPTRLHLPRYNSPGLDRGPRHRSLHPALTAGHSWPESRAPQHRRASYGHTLQPGWGEGGHPPETPISLQQQGREADSTASKSHPTASSLGACQHGDPPTRLPKMKCWGKIKEPEK